MGVKKALVVVTSTEKYAGKDKTTGLFLSEAADFYEVMAKAGWKMDFVSPKGGYVPLEPSSLAPEIMGPADYKCYADPEFRRQLGSSLSPDKVNPADYSVIYYTGGHGVVFDFPNNVKLQEIAAKIYGNGGIVSAVCHGVVGLFNIKLSNGELLIKGKAVTGFSNEEEHMIHLESVVPFLTEDVLKARGAKYESGPAFKTHVTCADRLITGQNPASGTAVALKVLEAAGH